MQNKVKIDPVHFYPHPGYPTRMAVQMNPSVLKMIPRRWHAKPALCMALAFTLSTGLYGCSRLHLDLPAGTIPTNTTGTSGSACAETGKTAGLSIPVFEHGTGRGSYGCVSVAPPVFLSEEEALQVIREEADARGVHFDRAKAVEGGDFPATSIFPGETTGLPTWEGTLELDGYDASLNIGFEFVSKSDVVAWVAESDLWCSVESYDMKGTAERLAQVVEQTAVFYDPGQDYDAFDYHQNNQDSDKLKEYSEQYAAEQKQIILEKLREQVQDFLDWLAAEGII